MWKNWLKKIQPTPSQQSTPLNSIIFEVDKESKINVRINIQDNTIENGKAFGLLLFLINEGYYVESTLNLLSSLSDLNPNNANFIQQTLSSWSNYVSEDINHDIQDPVIKPTEFNINK